MLEFAELVLELTGSASEVRFHPMPVDDLTRRCPEITLVKQHLNWALKVGPRKGLERTIAWFASRGRS